ncbi:hypothetical protein D9C73_027835 [Collichthys lucidus]|uniref:ribonuclease H n=1 Tax=Collichthys lucidus TaxID=240159 RepID=A0A4U5TUJ5_COLLU|nr:hypothetical protein D9C73_027835 [Collichthys lucidus]
MTMTPRSEDEEEDDTSVAPALAVKPKLPESTNREEGGVSSPAPSLHVDLLSTCKRAAEKLEVPWPAAVAEPTGSRYEGKRLPLARSAVKQLLPVFPELLAELSKTWNYCPYSNRSPIPGAASLDCEAMEAQGLLLMPPVEASVAAHLCPGSTSQLSAASSRRPTLPTKPEPQSALAERAYKAAALSARALNALSILTAYQAELFGASADEQDPDAWEEMAVIADLSLRIQRVSVQATGRVMATLVIQERARWLSLANLTDRERDDILDMPIVPEGVFGSALATMQQRCETKKKDNEALKLCLPRKAPTPSPPVQRKSFAQAASQPPHFKMPKAAAARPAPPSEERARSRLAQKISCLDRSPAAATGRRGLSHPGEKEEESGRTAFLSSGGASCCSPLCRPTVLAFLCASHAAAAHPRAGSRATGSAAPAAMPRGYFPDLPQGDATAPLSGPPVMEQGLQCASPLSLKWENWKATAASPPRVFIRCTEAAVAPFRRRGIRLATYLDDWLLLAQSEQEARVHTRIVTEHLINLGFVINMEKSQLSPTQEICFLGLSLRSVPFTARLSEERVKAFKACLARFRRRRSVQFRLCLRLLGLMASAILVTRLGRLHMREFQRWVASLRLDPVRHGARWIAVTADCVTALRHWRAPSFLTQRVSMGTVSSRKVVTTDASLSGWGGIFEGRGVRGRWSQALQRLHINVLELSAVFLSLKHFLPFLSGRHVLVRTDNTTTVAYINRQGGLRSRVLHTLARKLILWSSLHFRSLRATLVPGTLNTGADLLSRGAPMYGEWMLHPQVMEQSRSVRIQRKRSVRAVLLSTHSGRSPGRRRTSARLAARAALRVSSTGPNTPHPRQGEGAQSQADPDSSTLASAALASGDTSDAVRPALAAAGAQGLALAGGGGGRCSTRTRSDCNCGPGPSLYDSKWRVFERWCLERDHIPFQCSVPAILSFLQDLIDKGKAFSTVKVVGSCSPIELAAFAASPGEQRAHMLCPVRAVRSYMDRTQNIRRSDQLFVSWAEPRKGQPVTKQRLAHWVVEAIALAYTSRGLQPPAGVRAHSTRGMAASWALFRGVSVQDICSAASWSSPLTFVRFYMLDVSGPCVASAVLES